jgi:hypothetical protein
MDTVQLERECRSYTRYLTGSAPSPYVIAKYLDFHQKMGIDAAGDRFERLLLSISARGPVWTRLAESYATMWRKNSLLRKKLVVALALLECAPPAFETLDRCPAGGLAGTVFQLGWGAFAYACSLLAATALFSPMRLWMAVVER